MDERSIDAHKPVSPTAPQSTQHRNASLLHKREPKCVAHRNGIQRPHDCRHSTRAVEECDHCPFTIIINNLITKQILVSRPAGRFAFTAMLSARCAIGGIKEGAGSVTSTATALPSPDNKTCKHADKRSSARRQRYARRSPDPRMGEAPDRIKSIQARGGEALWGAGASTFNHLLTTA